MKLALAMTLGATVTATIVPGMDVNDLVSKSDLVLAGYISSSVDDGPTLIETPNRPVPGRKSILDVRVNQVLKGTGDAIVKVAVVQPDNPMELGYDYLYPKRFRVMFLRRAAGGYVLTSPYYPSVIAAPRDPVDGASPVAQVAAFVTAVLEAPGTPQQEKKDALWTLAHTKDPAAVAGLRVGFADADPIVRLTAVPGLLRAGDAIALPFTESVLLRHEPTAGMIELMNLLAGLRDAMLDVKAVPALVRLAQSGDVEVRRSAVSALVNTASPAAFPALLRAMDDGDREVQYKAVWGMAKVTGDLPIMSREGFESRMNWYFAFWTDWARARGIAR